jgi:hypothetical protein
MRCDDENIDLDILTDLYVFDTPEYENVADLYEKKEPPRDFNGLYVFRSPEYEKMVFEMAAVYVCMYGRSVR